MYDSNRQAFHQFVFSHSSTPYEDLYYLLKEISLDVKKKYQAEGIPEKIYVETMTDLDVWAQVYKNEHGVLGIKEYKWVEKSLDLKVFKLGRLQFEPVKDNQVEEFLHVRGILDEVIIRNTHIQSGEPLDFDLCQQSYETAVEFFKARGNGGEKVIFVCDSWLLNPKLATLLSANNNIVKFQQQYKIISKDLSKRQAEERLFQKVEDNPKLYKATTSLQMKVRDCLIKGERLGNYKGVNTKFL